MPRQVSLTVLLVLLLALPVTPALGSASSATGPDADGAFALRFAVTRASAGDAAVTLLLSRDDGAGSVASATRDLGRATFPAGASTFDVSYLPDLGAGSYEARLALDGAPGDALSFDVDASSDGNARSFSYEVEDQPTFLALTNDSVNADGRLKSPGEELVTRAMLSDANGMGDVESVAFLVERGNGSLVETGAVAWTADAANVSAPLELRYARSPIAAGAYRLTLVAMHEGAEAARASRTFAIRDLATTMANASLGNVTPDVNVTLGTTVVLADRNEPPTAPELRVYRGSARVEAQGYRATLGAPAPLADEAGVARVAFPLTLDVPAGAPPGAYRVSLYANGTLAGSVPFTVLPLPTLASLRAEPASDGALRLVANLTAPGVLRATLTDDAGSTSATTIAAPAGTSAITLDAPSRAATLRWSLVLAARADGAPLDARSGTWARQPPATPQLRVQPARAPAGRVPSTWTVDAPGWDLANATGNVTLLRWDGASAPGVSATFAGGAVQIRAPPTIEAGRYTARLDLAFANGTTANLSWTIDAAPWLRVTLGNASVAGREARVPIANEGGVRVGRLVVELPGAASVALVRADGTLANATARAGTDRFVVPDAALAPGEAATLVVRLSDAPQRAGEHAATLRVLALAEAA